MTAAWIILGFLGVCLIIALILAITYAGELVGVLLDGADDWERAAFRDTDSQG